MAKESDQTRWVGVRPTDPSENIPVTESNPLTSIGVYPFPILSEFKTLTRKRNPAIGDLQAVTGFVRFTEMKNNVGAPFYNHELYTVPAGKMFKLEFIQGMCWQADPTAISFCVVSGAVQYDWYYNAYGGAFEVHRQSLPIIYDENEIVRIWWNGTLATTDVSGTLFGHLLDRY